jgi:hypothetical protein
MAEKEEQLMDIATLKELNISKLTQKNSTCVQVIRSQARFDRRKKASVISH